MNICDLLLIGYIGGTAMYVAIEVIREFAWKMKQRHLRLTVDSIPHRGPYAFELKVMQERARVEAECRNLAARAIENH